MKSFTYSLHLLLIILVIPFHGLAQKKWDGQGNDSLWTNPKNWFPDGLPGIADDVVLDNSILNTSYHVLMNSDSGLINIRSISVLPQTQEIKLELPVSNKLAPALSLSATTNSLTIGPNGIFLNKSGALAGNSMELTGNLAILNEGTYLHATLRGNATIVSKLATGPSSSKGLFVFDVPGTSGYTVSITGRQFGILRFQSLLAGKKSYSGSGSSSLTLWGGLEIEDSTTLTSTLTGNIIVDGNLVVKGKLSILPPSTGNTGRELQMTGNNSSVCIPGQMETGANFRMMVVSSGTTLLRSNVRLDREAAILKVLRGASLDLDSFSITGPGWVVSDSGSTLKSSHSTFKKSDTTTGSIRSGNAQLHRNTHFAFYGNLVQHTGDGFPDSVGMLTINKTAQRLWLDKPLLVMDSLHLQHGIMVTDSLRNLKLSGGLTGGSRLSFIDGPLIRETKSQVEQEFPVGMNQAFHPLTIQGQNGAVQVSYFHQRPARATELVSPLENLVDTGFWQIRKADSDSVFSGTISILDSIPTPLLSVRTRRIAQWKADGWSISPTSTQVNANRLVSGQITGANPILIAIGFIEPSALPLERILLSLEQKAEGIKLDWTGEWEQENWQMEIEKSTDGRRFHALQIHEKKWMINGNRYEYWMSAIPVNLMYFRICATNEDGKKVFSNIVYAKTSSIAMQCYPNPATHILQIRLPEGQWKTLKIFGMDGRLLDMSRINTAGEISKNITMLPAGNYLLSVDDGIQLVCMRFIKK